MSPDLSPWFILVLASLATHRISVLISKETGPAFIFRKFRQLPSKKSSYHEGLSCQWCMSMYASAVVVGFLLWRGLVTPWESWMWWLAVSSGGVCINQAFTKA